jgi:hypothetical protein
VPLPDAHLYATLIILATLIIEAGFPFVPKQHAVLLTVGLPTVALALWARPEQRTRRALNRQLLHFVVPAAFRLAFGWASPRRSAGRVEVERLDPTGNPQRERLRPTGLDYGAAGSADP